MQESMTFASDIIQELRVVAFVHERAGQKRRDGESEQGQVRLQGRNRPGKHDLAEVGDMPVDRIQGKHELGLRGERVRQVEDRGPVHQKLQRNRPQIVDVAKKDEKGGKDHADADAEQQVRRNRIEKEQEPPGEGITIKNNEEFYIQLPDFLESNTNIDYQIVIDFHDEQGTIIKTVTFPSGTQPQHAKLTDTVTKDVTASAGGVVEFNSGNQQYESSKLEIAPNALSTDAQIIIKQLPIEDFISSTEQMAALYQVYSIKLVMKFLI